jgi:hypothetical protein
MLLALPTNIRQIWKSLPETNKLTYQGPFGSSEENKVFANDSGTIGRDLKVVWAEFSSLS